MGRTRALFLLGLLCVFGAWRGGFAHPQHDPLQMRYDELTARLEAVPEDIDARKERGYLLGAMKRYAEAEADFDLVVGRLPEDDFGVVNRGIARFFLRDYPAAAADLARGLALGSKMAGAPYFLGRILLEQGEFQAALADFAAARQVADVALVQIEQARALAAAGRFDEARALLDQVIARGEEVPSARCALSELWLAQSRPEEALAALDQLYLGAEPNPYAALAAAKAASALTTATSGTNPLPPGVPTAVELAVKARERISQFFELNPSDAPEIFLLMGDADTAKGDLASALLQYQAAANQGRAWPRAWRRTAVCAATLDKTDLAAQATSRAQALEDAVRAAAGLKDQNPGQGTQHRRAQSARPGNSTPPGAERPAREGPR